MFETQVIKNQMEKRWNHRSYRIYRLDLLFKVAYKL